MNPTVKSRSISIYSHTTSFASVTPRSPALRPAGRTGVRSKCSLHFSALFADKTSVFSVTLWQAFEFYPLDGVKTLNFMQSG